MLNPGLVIATAARAREESAAKIYCYTAKTDDVEALLRVGEAVDGLTVTLHTRRDLEPFLAFDKALKARGWRKSLRLNSFGNIPISGIEADRWRIKAGMRWVKHCPLPEDEIFMRLG